VLEDQRPYFVTPFVVSWDDAAIDCLNEYRNTFDTLSDNDLVIVYLTKILDSSKKAENAEQVRKAIQSGQFPGLRMKDLPCFWVADREGKRGYPLHLRQDAEGRVSARAVQDLMVRLIDGAGTSLTARALWWRVHAWELQRVMKNQKAWVIIVSILSVLLVVGAVAIVWAIRAPTDQFAYVALGAAVLIVFGLLVGFLYRLPADKVGAFLFILVLLGLVIWQAQRIREFGLVVVIYFLYVAAAMVGAWILFGMLESTGSLEGEKGGLKYRFGGAASVAVLILLLGVGFEVKQTARAFDVSFNLFDPAGELVEKDGDLLLLLNERKPAAVTKGYAQVTIIPSNWNGRKARVFLKVDGYRQADDSREVTLKPDATYDLKLVPVKTDPPEPVTQPT
jgi:hypothetical protein